MLSGTAATIARLIASFPPTLICVVGASNRRCRTRRRASASDSAAPRRVTSAAAPLAEDSRDRAWWVGDSAAVALAQIGGAARGRLLLVSRGSDPMARDMSTLVAGLSSAAVVEMSEV